MGLDARPLYTCDWAECQNTPENKVTHNPAYWYMVTNNGVTQMFCHIQDVQAWAAAQPDAS